MADFTSYYAPAQTATQTAVYTNWQGSFTTSSGAIVGIADPYEARYSVPCAPPCTRSPSPAPSDASDDYPMSVASDRSSTQLDGRSLMEALRAAYAKHLSQTKEQDSL